MHKTILVLEESQMVHDLFESALPEDFSNWTIEHESTPDNYLSKSKETSPDIIFLSNQDQKRNYATVKDIKAYPEFANTPILLLTSAKDKFDENLLQSIGIRGYVRKPFEMATLQKQIDIVLREQEKARRKKPKDELKNLNVIDDELLELVSGKTEPIVTIDNLEEELDPTLQLIPEDNEADEELEETELMAMDESDDFDEAEFLEEQTDFADLDEDDELDLNEPDTDEFEVELEEIDDESDFMDIDDSNGGFEEISPIAEPVGKGISSIELVTSDPTDMRSLLLNIPDDANELGYMELDVIPFRTRAVKSNVVETISDDFDGEKFVKDHSPAELEEDFTPVDIEFDINESATVHDDEIEIPHVEIIEDFYDGDEEEEEDLLEDQPMQELIIEGLDDDFVDDQITDDALEVELDSQEDEVVFEELEDNDDLLEETNIQQLDVIFDQEKDEDLSVVEQEVAVSDDEETILVEQAEPLDIEIDFENEVSDEGSVLFEESDDDEVDESELTEGELEKRRNDQLDIDLEEIAAAGSEDASATIQEMIGFRQVMKAKYEIPSDEIEEDTSDIFDDVDAEENDELLSDIDDELENEDIDLLVDDDVPEISEDETLTEEAQDSATLLGEDDEDMDLMKDVEDDDQIEDIEMLAVGNEALTDDGEEQLDDIDLLSDDEDEFDSELEVSAAEDDDSLILEAPQDVPDDSDLFKTEDMSLDEDNGADEDDMFEDVDLMAEIDDEDDSLLGSPEEETEDMDLLSDPPDVDSDMADLSDESFEEIELLTDEEEDESDDLDLLQVDEETSPEEDISGTSDDSPEADLLMGEEDVEDIDFLPVDETEAGQIDEEDTDIEEIPIFTEDVQTEAQEESDEGSIEDIDFLPIEDESDSLLVEEKADELETDEAEEDIPLGDMRAIDEADEITIEVPQETFEMGDFNINDLADDDDESPEEEEEDVEENEDQLEEKVDLMEGIETVKVEGEDELDSESLDNIDLPSMDEDLPDLPPILETDEDQLENHVEDDTDIQLMQNEDDFESFPGEDEVIGADSSEEMDLDLPEEVPSPESEDSVGDFDLDSQLEETTKALPSSLSPGFRNKLTAMIEGVISETVHNTLQEKLPDMVEQLMQEEATEDK